MIEKVLNYLGYYKRIDVTVVNKANRCNVSTQQIVDIILTDIRSNGPIKRSLTDG